MTPEEFVDGLAAGGMEFADDDPNYCPAMAGPPTRLISPPGSCTCTTSSATPTPTSSASTDPSLSVAARTVAVSASPEYAGLAAGGPPVTATGGPAAVNWRTQRLGPCTMAP